MPLVKRVDPPSDLGPCEQCRYWLWHERVEVATMQGPGGTMIGVAREEFEEQKRKLAEQGQVGQAPLVEFTVVSDCARLPQWQKNPREHWCFSFEPLTALDYTREDARAQLRADHGEFPRLRPRKAPTPI